MEGLVRIERVEIFSKGDESVGIPAATWGIEPELYVNAEDLETFRNNLQTAWKDVVDDAVVYFTVNEKPLN